MSNSSWKINVSILYYVPHSCDNTAYATTSLRDKKEKYSNSCVVRKIISERNKKTYPPLPLVQVKWSVPYVPHSCDNTSYATSSSSSSFTTENRQLDECYFPAHAWHDNVFINFHFCNFVFFFLFSIR
jgi:hypothetical protein